MAGIAKTAQEILLEQLAKTVAGLSSEQKAKEAAIRELNTQLTLTERALPGRIADLEKQFTIKRDELALAIAPMEERRATVLGLETDIRALRQLKLDAIAEARAAKGPVIKAADQRVAEANEKLAKIETAMAVCKAKVSAL